MGFLLSSKASSRVCILSFRRERVCVFWEAMSIVEPFGISSGKKKMRFIQYAFAPIFFPFLSFFSNIPCNTTIILVCLLQSFFVVDRYHGPSRGLLFFVEYRNVIMPLNASIQLLHL